MDPYRRHMDRAVRSLGPPALIPTRAVGRMPGVDPRPEDPHFAHDRRLPVRTVRIRARQPEGDVVSINDATAAIVDQGLNAAYGVARADVPGRVRGGPNPDDHVTVWLEARGFGRDMPRIVLARDVRIGDVAEAVEARLWDVAEYEAAIFAARVREFPGTAGGLQPDVLNAFIAEGFNFRDFRALQGGVIRNVTRNERADMLRQFLATHSERLEARVPGIMHQLGWSQLARYLEVGQMDIFYRFYMHPGETNRSRRAPRGWKDGLQGMSRNQLWRIGGIIPKEVTEGNGLCLFLAVEYATTFVFDVGAKELQRLEVDLPVALRSWEAPVRRLQALRDSLGFTPESLLQDQLNALSLEHSAVIHVFDYEAGGIETVYSTEEVCHGKCESHKVIMIMDDHAYPITKPHFLVQNTARHLFCPVCFHCFGKKKDLFYHMERCSRSEPMDSIDYQVRRKFEKRSFMGLHFAIKGVVFRQCIVCGKLGLQNGADVDLGVSEIEYCSCLGGVVAQDGGRTVRALRCMRCQVAFPPSGKASHKCRMRVREDSEPDLANIWVYDIESALDTVNMDEDVLDDDVDWSLQADFDSFRTMRQSHTPNLVVMMSLVDGELLSFTTIPQFLDYIYGDERFDGACFYAHNAGRYDTHFIVNELLRRGCVPDFMPGSSSGYSNMLMVGYEGRMFRDSYRLFPQGLAALAKSFGLPMAKGRFPYRFNCRANQDYCGPLPSLEWFDPWDVRGDGSMAALLEWHKEESVKYAAGTWSLQGELYRYCVDDVRILREVMLKGVHLFLGIFQSSERRFLKWEPPMINITSHLTLTSAVVGACLYGMRNKCRLALRDVDGVHVDAERFYDMVLAYEHFFREKSLRVIPDLESLTDGLLRGYEVEPGVVRVYVDCFTVGCSKCYPTQKLIIPPNRHSFASLREGFEEMRPRLWKLVGVAGVEMLSCYWTHEYQEMFQQVPRDEQALLHRAIDPYWPIDAREAMFGGHTEAGALFAKSYGRHKICKIDVNSMYPFVCADLELPFGDPVTLRMDDVDREMFERREYFGLIRARFCPPKDLLFPILPRKVGHPGKLVFDCEDRVGTYTTVDVYHALDLGYRVEEIYEIRHFPPSQRMVGLFAEYVTVLFDVKAQAKRDEDPALYLLCKFALNSLWGKFGEKVHTSYFGFVSSIRGYMDFMHAETIRDGSREFMEVADEVYLVKATYEDVVCDAPRFYHPELACFVLAHARKILHSAIYDLGPGRFLYCDTDSIIYLHTLGQSTPSIGTALGEWDVEVAGWPERYIERFYSCGPKAYCEVYSDGTHKVCYKGVMGSCRNKRLMEPEQFHELVVDYLHHQGMEAGSGMTLSTQDFSIRVNYSSEGGVDVRSDYTVKRVRVVNEKRFVPDLFGEQEDIEQFVIIRTLPFGFQGDVREMAYVTPEVFSRDFQY